MTEREPDSAHNPQLDPMSELVDEMRLAFEGKIQGEEAPTSIDIDQAFSHAFEHIAPELVRRQLEVLTPIEFAEVYVRILGDTAFRAQLDDIAALKVAELTRTTRIKRLQQETLMTSSLNIANLQPNEVIKIGLFNPTMPKLAAKRYSDHAEKRPLQRVVAVRTVDPIQSKVEVIYDNWVGAGWDQQYKTESIPPLSIVTISPILQLHAPIRFDLQDQRFTHPQIIGYVETTDDTVLLDNPQSK